MPLLIGTGRRPVVPVVGLNDVGTIHVTYTDPTGQVWELSNTSDELGVFTRPEIAGWGAKPYEFVTDPLPRGGEQVRYIRGQASRLTWPLHTFADTHQQYIDRLRGLRRAFLLTVYRRQTGLLRVARPDGTAREIDCFYEDGFGGNPGEDWISGNPVLTLYCPDGYWKGLQQVKDNRFTTEQVPFLDPFPTVSNSWSLGLTEIDNPGDVEGWPTWTITGPMMAATFTNHTTGLAFTVTYTLLADEQIVITTGPNGDPGAAQRPTFRGPGGINVASAVNWPEAYLWPLLPGINSVELAVDGADTGTDIAWAYYPRYDGA